MSRSKPNVLLLCGVIFLSVGLVTLVVGYLLLRGLAAGLQGYSEGNTEILPFIFFLTGGIAAAVGAGLLIKLSLDANRKNRLMRGGYYVTASITGFPADFAVTVNGRPTYYLECAWQDPETGTVHVFKSDNLMMNPSEIVTQKTVKVYLEQGGGYKHYHVDTASVLPEIQMH